MRDNIIALPVGRIRRDTAVNRRKQYMDLDLYVNMVESDPGHIARRRARQMADIEARQRALEETDGLIELLGTTALLSILGGTLATALALVL